MKYNKVSLFLNIAAIIIVTAAAMMIGLWINQQMMKGIIH